MVHYQLVLSVLVKKLELDNVMNIAINSMILRCSVNLICSYSLSQGKIAGCRGMTYYAELELSVSQSAEEGVHC